MEITSPVSPALRALTNIRTTISSHVGKEGGNLNQKVHAQLDVIEATLMQIEPLGNMMKLVNQQSQLTVRLLSDLARISLPPGSGDNGDSHTKGE